jgi:hydroxymethylbilane synthase
MVIGTRGSDLALKQAEEVRCRLSAERLEWRFALKRIRTHGDRNRRSAVPSLGRVGVFTSALERALAAGEIDLAVHSLKDVPTALERGLALEVVTPRADPRDALVSPSGKTLADLPPGSVVGTGSARRAAFALALRPDLIIRPLRGNVGSRLAKVKGRQFDAGIFALAGLARLGLSLEASEVFDPETITPAPGQGALAVEYRSDDAEAASLLAEARDEEGYLAVMTERAVLRRLGGGCLAPIGVLARVGGPGWLRVLAAVAAPDGSRVVRVAREGSAEPEDLSEQVVSALRERGAGDLLRAARGDGAR